MVGPLTVAEPPPPLVEVRPTPVVITLAPSPAAVPAPEPEAVRTPGYPMAETVLWAGFASVVSCAVVAGGQGPREEALWILGIGGGALTTAGLGLLGVRRLRRGRT